MKKRFGFLVIPLFLFSCAKGPTSVAVPPEPGVVGGSLPAESDLIQHSTVFIKNSSGDICSGSLVAPNVVLTAAHCATYRNIQVVFVTGNQSTSAGVSNTIIHPDYFASQRSGETTATPFDVALLKLNRLAPSAWKPIALSDLNPVGKDIFVAGFGKTLNSIEDRQILDRPLLRVARMNVSGFEQELLVLTSTGHQSLCGGDSGGPTYLIENDQVTQVGINEGVTAGCHGKSFVVWLQPHLEFIRKTLESF
jgi:secreted trypsin-like serine protease